ncbi:isoprenoid biosynthesis glyoxalase ElbB [Desulfoprunum benzoelyticum]|uniref:Enhancing lycopene biosynthesis protein 2 n=1 Tax=Desulfoprunum benzoelyticum TaxID=1506996 RepID=A0A840V191_9BACT|nr:isoprenoid biosynthesis glyoxalase ElbB [Desulfoprunum benzoelyticum]MBB5346961.1 enhancing lycopene biosynthesis protein 2 [Desulfoprunum benzoelyticum]MBM9531021.1 isoprenoid biosynthesis glyoxalase ElbB [Desulfoprunum benzoelyticum]
MSRKPSIAVILAGCGNKDGAEIHEATLTLWAIHRHGADYQCYAPDKKQHHVLNHITGEEMAEERNVLIEAARIARGDIKSLAQFDAQAHDVLILPGGFGAAKNLCTYAFDGPECTVDESVAAAVQAMYLAKKPIGALCIAPVILARLLPNVMVTIGSDVQTAGHITRMGGRHQNTTHGEIAVDTANRVVTTPCYMLDARVDQIGEGAERLVLALLEMIEK